MAGQSKLSRLAQIGVPSSSEEITDNVKVNAGSITEQIEVDDVIYKIIAELEQNDMDRFFDLKYHLMQKLGNCTNKDVLAEALNHAFVAIKDIKPRPDSVKQREKTPSRVAKRRYTR